MSRSKSFLLWGAAGAMGAWTLSRVSRKARVSSTLQTVPAIELRAFTGRWHEIMRIPSWYERDCDRVTVEYGLDVDESLVVVNTCERGHGKRRVLEGRAWVADRSAGAKLKVGFLKVKGWYPTAALSDLWILELGPQDETAHYTYAVLGEPERRQGWILARQPELDDEIVQGILTRLQGQGYRIERFKRTAPDRGRGQVRSATRLGSEATSLTAAGFR